MFHRSYNQRLNQPDGKRPERGQGLIEYALLLSLIALAVMVIINLLEPAIGNVFSQFASNAPVAPPSLLSYTPPPTNTLAPTINPSASPSVTPTPSSTPLVPPTATNTVVPSPSATLPPSPTASNTPVPTPNILFVVGHATTLDALDAGVRTQLAASNPVFPGDESKILVLEDSAAQTSDATGKLLVVISSSSDSADVGTKFRNVAVPVILWEDSLYVNMGMVSGGHSTANSQKNIEMVNNTHPLSNGYSGTIPVYSSNSVLTYAQAGPGATVIARQTGNHPYVRAVIFAYATGAPMPTTPAMNAPARRVAFFLEDSDMNISNLTPQGLILLSKAICWSIGTC